MSILTKPCKQCKNDFKKKPSVSMKLWLEATPFCSKDCYTESQKGKDPFANKERRKAPSRKGCEYPSLQGANNPSWSRVEKTCIQCKTPFVVKRHLEDIAKFCCHKCSTNYRNKGKTKANEAARKTAEYRKWRKSVYERDDYTCTLCGERGGQLHADHIKPFAMFVELRYDIDNGRTLCVPCHKETPTYGRRTAVVTEA